MNIAPSARSALTDVERNFVPEFNWLERAANMQWIASIATLIAACDVAALNVSDLANAARIGAA
jgi:hypothetical protein